MIEALLASETDFAAWRALARRLCAAWTPPEEIAWAGPDAPAALFCDNAERRAPRDERAVAATPDFVASAERVICHRDPERFARLYRILWRLQDDRRGCDLAARAR